MTREEAIQLIDEIASSYYPCDKKDALEMAIKALEPCEDCISREQAIKQCGFGMTSLLIADNLRRLPPVHPKIKTGHWIEYTRVLIPEPINRWEQAWYCSECGYGNQECEDGSARPEWKCCPCCGARMIEPQGSEGEK